MNCAASQSITFFEQNLLERNMDSVLSFKACESHTNRQSLILVVEDDDDNLLLLSYAIEAFGCRFIGQSCGEAALAVAREHQPDLILLDILMPSVDGIQLLQRLKQDASTCQIPVIAVTALARTEDRQLLLQAGFTDYISKPYMLDDLEALIHRHLPAPKPQDEP